jgi:glycosyltransferase involved in cell wall biosynthesis
MRGSEQARRVLLIAFHFPPIQGSSGVQRTLRFAQHLPRFGWRPEVLTIAPEAYEATSHAAGNEVPPDLAVHRARGFDAARQLSVAGIYPRALAMPDRWATWRLWAVRKALRIVRRQGVDAVWSTFPIATAHSIGLAVAQRSGLPWIAEFRDPMWQGDYPPDPRVNAVWKRMEGEIFAQANRVVVTTPGAAEEYASRFQAFPRNRIVLIENGFDEDTFIRAAASIPFAPVQTVDRPITLLHSGIVYRSERDPTHLFSAIARLKKSGRIAADRFQLVLRASGDEAGFNRDVERFAIKDIVRLEPAIDYLRALQEMLTVDGLLVLQASNCNAQVPAKLYEYLRAGRPIVALTDPAGDTARTLESAGAGILARLDSVEDIEHALLRFIAETRSGTWRRPSPETIAGFSRQSQARQLATLLDAAVEDRSAARN